MVNIFKVNFLDYVSHSLTSNKISTADKEKSAVGLNGHGWAKPLNPTAESKQLLMFCVIDTCCMKIAHTCPKYSTHAYKSQYIGHFNGTNTTYSD
jgi:hypothetical protein